MRGRRAGVGLRKASGGTTWDGRIPAWLRLGAALLGSPRPPLARMLPPCLRGPCPSAPRRPGWWRHTPRSVTCTDSRWVPRSGSGAPSRRGDCARTGPQRAGRLIPAIRAGSVGSGASRLGPTDEASGKVGTARGGRASRWGPSTYPQTRGSSTWPAPMPSSRPPALDGAPGIALDAGGENRALRMSRTAGL